MIKNVSKVIQRTSISLLGLGLAVIYFSYLFFAASGKALWVDEVYSISTHQVRSFGTLLFYGMSGGQPSTSPLPYILEKAWIQFWPGFAPTDWDLRTFLRIPSIFYTALASGLVFSFLHYWLWKRSFSYGLSLALALWASSFYFSNSFTQYYALEARPYGLWYFFSTLQALNFFYLITTKSDPDSKEHFSLNFFIRSFLYIFLATTTYGSLVQIYVLEGLLFLHSCVAPSKKKLWSFALLGRTFLTLLPGTAVGLYYYSFFDMTPFPPPNFSLFLSSVQEVVQKTWHHHGPEPLLVTLPFLFLFCPIFWWKKSRVVFWLQIPGICLLGSSLVLYVLTLWKGGILASRYFIFLVPFLTMNYFVGVFTLGWLANEWLIKRNFINKYKLIFLANLLILGLAGAQLWKVIKALPEGHKKFFASRTFHPIRDPLCQLQWEVELEPLRQKRQVCLGDTE